MPVIHRRNKPQPYYGTVSWSAGFETNDFSEFDAVHAGTEGDTAVTIDTTTVRQGGKSAKMRTTSGGTGNYIRAELSTYQASGKAPNTDGADTYYSFSVYVPTTPNVATGWVSDTSVIAQWSPQDWYNGNSFSCNTPCSFNIENPGTPQFEIQLNGQSYGGTTEPVTCVHNSAATQHLSCGPVVYDRWIDFTFHIKISANAGVGFIQVWRDRAVVLAQTAGRTAVSTSGTYYEMDLYHLDQTTGNQHVVFFDNVKRHTAYRA